MTRTRTITWQDPAEAAMLSAGAHWARDPPPHLLGVDPGAAGGGSRRLRSDLRRLPGLLAFAYEPREEHYNTLGAVHGGILTTVLDTVMGCAVHSQSRPGSRRSRSS